MWNWYIPFENSSDNMAMFRQLHLLLSLNKKLCTESILKSVAEIFVVTVSHSKKIWRYLTSQGSWHIRQQQWRCNVHFTCNSVLFLPALQKSVYLSSVSILECGMTCRDWKRPAKLCARRSPSEWAGLAGLSWPRYDLPHGPGLSYF